MNLALLYDFGGSFFNNGFTLLLIAILAVSSLAFKARPSLAGLAAILLYVVSFLLSNMWLLADDRNAALKLYQLGAFVVIVLYVGLLWCFIRKPQLLKQNDVIAQLYWIVLLFAEFGQALEYMACRVLHDPYTEIELARSWGTTVSKYACSRAYGEFAPYVLPAITTLFLAWPAVRAYQVWKQTTASGGRSSEH
ncbi:MAG: hypothetical protein ACR2QC_07825 [Gammaproteobacteria bacterium]